MDLTKFNVVELNAQEKQNVDGGLIALPYWKVAYTGIALATVAAVAVMSVAAGIGDGIREGLK